jgi:signal transduction histidine kinase
MNRELPDDSVTHLKSRICELERENAALRTRLEEYNLVYRPSAEALPARYGRGRAVQVAEAGEILRRTLDGLAARDRRLTLLEQHNRLAREVHDTLAQGLTGIIVQLQAAQHHCTTDPTERAGHVERARHLARECLAQARQSVRSLRPS